MTKVAKLSAKQSIPREVSFFVSSRTLRMLGRENVSSPAVALMELVKNAYDADADNVTVTFTRASRRDGEITIEDTGDGMDLSELRSNWMVVGTDVKERQPLTKKRRVKVGKKGIGRFALERLSDSVAIETFTKGSTYGLRLTIDWTKYSDPAVAFHQVKHPLQAIKAKRAKGTTLHLSKVRDRWTRRHYENLHRDLTLILPPFDATVKGFRINLDIDEAPDLSGPVKSALGAFAEYTLESKLQRKGEISHVLTHRDGSVRKDRRLWHEAFDDAKPGYVPECGSLEMKILWYLRDATYYKDLDIKLSELKRFLDAYQGVRIYRDGFRVKPYGDPTGEQDWLGLNLRRTESPEAVTGRSGGWRAGENQLIGTVFITKRNNPDLEDKTDREGLFENQAFYDLKKFVLHGIQFLERERQKREKALKPKKEVIDVGQKVETSTRRLKEQAARRRSEDKPKDAEEIEEIAQELTAVKEEYEELQTEHHLMLGLATLGIAMAAFGHETSAAINTIANRIEPLEMLCSRLPKRSKNDFYEHLNNIRYNIGLIENWGQFALDHVRRDKRTRRNIDLNAVITGTVEYFIGSFKKRSIRLTTDLDKKMPSIRAFPMDMEALIINFIINSIEALNHTPLERRAIEITTEYNKTTREFILRFRDSGKGIRKTDLDKIYDPLFSTKVDKQGKPYGTGLGLTIVKKVVEEYDGSIETIGKCDLGGAQFSITIAKGSR